jgi:hypothetical protein
VTPDITAVDVSELMPIGQYPNWNACMVDQQRKGHSEESARKMCGFLEHRNRQGMKKIDFVYQASFEPYEEQGKRLAKIQVIDLDPNRNNWQVTPSARAKALKTLLDSPLLGPPPEGERGNVSGGLPGSPHEGYWTPVGRFVDFESNHVTRGIAEITKDYAWEKIKSKEWKAVSPSILAAVEHQEGDTAVVDDFVFEHVLFVDKPAYPGAGVEGICEGDSCNFNQALQAALECSGAFTISQQDLSVMEKAVQSARGILQSLEERMEIILYGKPEPEPAVPPLPLPDQSQGSKEPRQDGGSYSPERAGKDTRHENRGSTGGGIVEKNTTVLQAADAWNTADAPDKFFAIVPDEAKGPNGQKSLRKIPLASVQKEDLDGAIIRDAVSRLPQTKIPQGFREQEVLQKICAAAHSLGLDLPSCTKQGGSEGDSNMDSKECGELQARIRELEPLQSKVTTLEAKVTGLETENKELKAYKADIEKRERAAKIQTIVDLKSHCGLIDDKDRAQAMVELEKASAETLDGIERELRTVQARLDSMPSGPKAKFEKEQAQQHMEDVRQAMYGYRRNEKGEIVATTPEVA